MIGSVDPPDCALTDHPGYCCIDNLTEKKLSDRHAPENGCVGCPCISV
jgi:hypothetical protein